MCKTKGRPRDRPGKFYEIVPLEDGLVDVYLCPDFAQYTTIDGLREYDLRLMVVRGVVYYPGLEEDVRAHFYDWCESAEVIDL